MNATKLNPVGIDISIQGYQTYLYNKLKAAWTISNDTDFNMYGRVYRNQTNDGYTPEAYTGKNEYSDVLFNDSLSASAFFGVGENTVVNGVNITADAFIIFMVNLDKIKPGITRQDEEARLDVELLCMPRMLGFNLTGFVTGIDNVFKEYSGWKKTNGIKFMDQHPWHCFRINFKLLYSLYQC